MEAVTILNKLIFVKHLENSECPKSACQINKKNKILAGEVPTLLDHRLLDKLIHGKQTECWHIVSIQKMLALSFL